jgi:hypothetical protein
VTRNETLAFRIGAHRSCRSRLYGCEPNSKDPKASYGQSGANKFLAAAKPESHTRCGNIIY